MRRFVLAVIGLAMSAAGAAADGGCYARRYSAEHLLSNPDQDVRSIVVRLFRDEGRFAETRVWFRDSRRVWTQRLNCHTDNLPRKYRDASMICVVDCDGGSFYVRPRGNAILISTEGGWIVGEGGCGDPDKTLRHVTDRGAARTTFKLYPVEMEVCK